MDSAPNEDPVLVAAQRIIGQSVVSALPCPDPVNVPMARNWLQAIGDRNPVYLNEHVARRSAHGRLVAPPTMLRTWSMQLTPNEILLLVRA